MGNVYVRRRSGLLEPFEVPELTIEKSIDRGCVQSEGGLLKPKPEEYLTTVPATVWRSWGYYGPVIEYGPVITGLPEV